MDSPLYFLGLRFWNGSSDALLKRIDETGGMLAVPSAPSLAQAAEDPLLMKAYRTAEWSVMDGGYVALIVRLLGRKTVRISGLQLISKLIATPEESPVPMRERRILWVVPSTDEKDRISQLLETKGFQSHLQTFYEAPFYQSDEAFHDASLIETAKETSANWIILCLGGGRQEKLGYFLQSALNSAQPARPVILCTGAAIAFFTGGQAAIPTWADRLYLGWLFRICEKPGVFIPRYVKAFWHFPLALWHFRNRWFDEKLSESPAS